MHDAWKIIPSPTDDLVYKPSEGNVCLDEAQNVIRMPKFDATTALAILDYGDADVGPNIVAELREYVSIIASSYRNNPFHNFEHACHVTMSVNKLLKRIVAPDFSKEELDHMMTHTQEEVASHLHDFPHGINSDPMALFAITFSALIHDVDHRGVSNMIMMQEEPAMAVLYRNKSIAEQNSLDTAWELLMLDQFTQLRRCVFGTRHELMRFRQLIVNVVLATDIFDKEFNELRRNRWEQAFSASDCIAEGLDANTITDMRATIVMEHIIQASDVSHTMQHWHVYQKWNRYFFTEMYNAFKAGRSATDPSTFWYKGELGFFDNYVIPLAKKLKECNVFGVSSDEYLNYAILNRAEWEDRGQKIVESLLSELGTMVEP